MMKVFLTDKMFYDYETPRRELAKLGAELVIASKPHDTETFIKEGSDADVVICIKGPLEDEFIDSLTKCRMVIRTGVGVDAANVPACNRRGIPVCHVPNFCRDEVADQTLAMMLAMLRGLPFYDKMVKSGGWNLKAARVPRIQGLTVGIVGYGGIGARVGQRCKAFGMNVIAYDPEQRDEMFHVTGAQRAEELDEVWAAADIVTIHIPLLPDNEGILCKENIDKMKDGVYLINTARGGHNNEADIAAAVKSGKIYMAAIDVASPEPRPYPNELSELDNVILTPHTAFYSERSMIELEERTWEEVYRALTGKRLKHVFNKDDIGYKG